MTITDDDIKARIKQAMHGNEYDDDTINIARADRHNRTSRIDAIVFRVDALSFENVSELAGAFMTPNIKIEPQWLTPEPDATIGIEVTIRAPGDESQLIVEGEVEEIEAPS